MRVDLTLEPGAVAQSVEVQAAAPIVNSENATIGNILDRLIRISAGVTADSASNPRVAGSFYWGGVQFSVPSVTSITKSGSNEWHGTAYEFNRNRAQAYLYGTSSTIGECNTVGVALSRVAAEHV